MSSSSYASSAPLPNGNDPSPRHPGLSSVSPRGVLSGLLCVPSRRSLKFTAGPHARHFLAFDTSISRESRLLLFMELFVFRQLLVEVDVLPAFQVATYTPEELLEVRVVTDPRHPAYGQAGLYAKNTIPYNTIVTPYAGFIEVFATSCNSRTYTMGFGSISDDYALDAEFVGNYGRYANDPRGVGTLQANLSAENRFNSRGESFTALVARRQISAGEEILMSYGKAHRLSSTPWTTMQGEPIMRPRMGGVLPFPSFRTAEPSRSEEARSVDDANDAGAIVFGSSDGEESVGPANDLLWECTQCGMWTRCEASVADAPVPCSGCGTPKLTGARMVSLLSSPAITQRALLIEAGRREYRPSENSASSVSSLTSPLSQASAEVSLPPSMPCGATSTAANATISSSATFNSVQVDWPMNVPFLPWQVWDAAVPLSVVAKHTRFETQEHTFLYTVDTGLGRERRTKRDRDKTAAAGDNVGDDDGDDGDAHLEKSGHVRRRAETSGLGSGECRGHFSDSDEGEVAVKPRKETEEEDEDEANSAPQPTTATRRRVSFARDSHADTVRSSRRKGGGGGGRGNSHPGGRLKRGVLWERQGDVDLEDLARLNRGWTVPLRLHARSSLATQDDTMYSAHIFSPFSLTPQQLQRSLCARGGSVAGRDFAAYAGGDDFLNTVRSPLSFLVSPLQEVDRLIVLQRGHTNTVNAAAPTSAAFLSSDDAGFSPQVINMRRRLRCMTRRLFTGKTFQAGEVVSYIGGLVRQHGDARCCVSDSCLEIPLRFFLPPALRRLCRLHAADKEKQLLGARGSGEGTVLHGFCQRVDQYSLVVTNEFMYCPCVVWEDADEAASSEDQEVRADPACQMNTMDEVTNALSACNVALVLTLDSLGCPFACAVATKAIGAFEPLLARAQ